MTNLSTLFSKFLARAHDSVPESTYDLDEPPHWILEADECTPLLASDSGAIIASANLYRSLDDAPKAQRLSNTTICGQQALRCSVSSQHG
jgi:hypothetical protein